MPEDNAQEAKDRAKQASGQAKAAAKNSSRAAKAAAEAVADEARDTVDKAEGTVDDAVEAAKKVNVGVLGKMSSDTGVGFLALSVSIYAGAIAYAKFRQAASGRTHVIDS